MNVVPADMNATRRAFRLALFTVTYNLAEGCASVLFSARDNSVALLGFGLDSFVESFSGAAMLWRFWDERAEGREHVAQRLVGFSLILLAAYVAYESISALISHERPERTLATILIAIASLVVMPILFLLKRRTSYEVHSSSLLADARQTLACMLLSAVLLIGTGLNYAFGVGQADAIVGLLISLYCLWEGYEALSGREACHC